MTAVGEVSGIPEYAEVGAERAPECVDGAPGARQKPEQEDGATDGARGRHSRDPFAG